jgi:hypothetical protein
MGFNWGNAGIGAFGGGGITGALSGFMDDGSDAYAAAEKAANQGWNEAQGFEKPYWQQGLDQYGRLNSAENSLLDPGALEAQWAAGYQTSPYAKQMLEQNKNSGLDAASSMGLMGSSAAMNNIQVGAGNIVNQDRQQYMNDLMNKYLAGIGIGQNIYGTGAQMGGLLGGQAIQHGEDLAGLEYGRVGAPGQMRNQLIGTIFNTGANLATGGMNGGGMGGGRSYFGGGYSG